MTLLRGSDSLTKDRRMAEDRTVAADASPWARETWWSGRRRRYNLGLLVAGVAGFIGYAAAVERCIALHAPGDWEITIFTTIFQAFAYLVMVGVANVFFLLGPWSERSSPTTLQLIAQ